MLQQEEEQLQAFSKTKGKRFLNGSKISFPFVMPHEQTYFLKHFTEGHSFTFPSLVRMQSP